MCGSASRAALPAPSRSIGSTGRQLPVCLQQRDPKGGILDRCTATASCPKIVHAATALEMWELRQSLGFTDPLGIRDLVEPSNVRSYILASTQHTSAQLPLATREPFGACQQQPNPNPHTWTVRALLTNLTAWIKDGAEPPPSARPTIAAGTLVAPDQVHFPPIPANAYGNVARPLVAQVDADGNDLGGIRNVFLQVPIGTYTGWNLFNRSFYEDGFCTLQGSFIPFARTRQKRLDAGDPRLSIEERYPSKETYVAAIKKAADGLVADRYLLPEDASRLVSQAEREGVRLAP
jgi:Alpha/beta hydrolase domain